MGDYFRFRTLGRKIPDYAQALMSQPGIILPDQTERLLKNTVLADSTSVLNFGIILGAFIASAFQGNFKPKKIKPGIAGAALIGGLLMGYGSRLAFQSCNIGAYFSGIASFSLHGWVWMIMAIIGTYCAIIYPSCFLV